MPARGSRQQFKACIKCKMLVPPDTKVCPNCGGRDFTTDWEGAVVIIDPEKSQVARTLGITKPGIYAIKVR